MSLPDFAGLARIYGSQEPSDPLADDEARCQCCSERVLKVATKVVDGDVLCLDCAREALDDDDTQPGVRS